MNAAEIRRKAAALVRDIRAMCASLIGDWTIREWNAKARTAGRSYVRNMTHFQKVNK